MKAALLIVDMQELLIPLVWQGEALADRIAGLAREARRAGAKVVALRQIGPPGSTFDPAAPETRLSHRLALEPTDTVVEKTATDAFYDTALAGHLHDVDTVVITGVATDYCVDATARSAQSHGFDVILVSDGHAPAEAGEPTLTPQQVIDRHNRLLSTATHPGGTLSTRRAADITFTR
jgi:nicotinamidase-related amidase